MKTGPENRTRVGRKRASKSKLRIKLKVRPKVDLRSKLRKEVTQLKLILKVVEACKENIGEHISISAIEVLVRVGIADLLGEKLTAPEIAYFLGTGGNPKSKSTVHRNISIFTGSTRNKHRSFKLIEQVVSPFNKKRYELVLTEKGIAVLKELVLRCKS
ncbi:MAG: hypothetical protein ABJI60_19630 [Kangiellaceae bacterium]